MRWSRGHTAGIEDRRSQGATGGGFGGFGGGSGGGIPIPMSVGGGGGLLIVIAIIVLNLLSSGGSGGGGGLGGVLGQLGGAGVAEPGGTADLSNNGDEVQFMGYVLDDANSLWADTFQRAGKPYTSTKLVLFTGSTQSGCGPASAETGPFYCPTDQKVYLDLDFFKELRDRFGAQGDFAEAYVVAHEVGHHVQEESGIGAQVRDAEQQDPSQQNALSVKLELQADCLAGVWAQSAYQAGDLDPGDIDEGLNAASAVGDDRIQASAGMAVNPETWTHGSAAQRSSWFKKGYTTGDPAGCDTFAAN
jgi:hypothetical protein